MSLSNAEVCFLHVTLGENFLPCAIWQIPLQVTPAKNHILRRANRVKNRHILRDQLLDSKFLAISCSYNKFIKLKWTILPQTEQGLSVQEIGDCVDRWKFLHTHLQLILPGSRAMGACSKEQRRVFNRRGGWKTCRFERTNLCQQLPIQGWFEQWTVWPLNVVRGQFNKFERANIVIVIWRRIHNHRLPTVPVSIFTGNTTNGHLINEPPRWQQVTGDLYGLQPPQPITKTSNFWPS